MEKRWSYIILITLVSITFFYISNHVLKGYLRHPRFLGRELLTPLDSLDEYRLVNDKPFKYRLVFYTLIKTTYGALTTEPDHDVFFKVYKSWSLVFYVTSALSLFYLLTSLHFDQSYSFAGVMIFLLLPPMLLAFSLPIHTREDTLAYTIFFVALNSLLKEKWWVFLGFTILGVLTRETLLLLPLLYFFYSKNQVWVRRFLIAGVPMMVWLGVRFVMADNALYDPWIGLKWNLKNPEQVIGFLFITFSFCWIPFILHLMYYRSSIESAALPAKFFYRSSVFCLLVILSTTFLGGIFNEIRLLYLYFPWIIVIFLDFIRENSGAIRTIIVKKSYWLYTLTAFTVCAGILFYFLKYWNRFIEPSKWNVPHEYWITITMFYSFILLLILPVTIRIISLRKTE